MHAMCILLKMYEYVLIVLMHMCMHVVHVCMYTYTCTYVHTYVHVYVCTCTCTCVCMSDAAIVLCDVNVPGSIKAAAEWKKALSATMPTLLIGNKWDLITDFHNGFQAGADLELVAQRAQFCSWLIADSTDQGFVKERDLLQKRRSCTSRRMLSTDYSRE